LDKKPIWKKRGEGEEVVRVRIPREGEVLGIVTARMAASKFSVSCADKKDRMCRIPGKIKRKTWVKEGDIVIVKPWEIEGEKKGDIIWRYIRIQVDLLRKKGLLKDLNI